MASIKINEMTGSDNVSGSRTTINSNFIILQNWINGYNSVFGIDTKNGILDLSAAPTGKVQAKIGRFDSISVPSTGNAKGSVNNVGGASFSDVQTTTFTASGAVIANGTITFGTQSISTIGGTASFNGYTTFNNSLLMGPLGHTLSQNSTYKTGATAGQPFLDNTAGGGGFVSSVNSPYPVTGLEDVIYAECGPSGFYMKVVDGDSPVGGTLPNISQGTRLTIVNTTNDAGYIHTGIKGSPQYYTGFNDAVLYGGFATGGIAIPSGKAYRSSITLQWENRIANGQSIENGSWIVIGSTNVTV
jgi:hypothetical protein